MASKILLNSRGQYSMHNVYDVAGVSDTARYALSDGGSFIRVTIAKGNKIDGIIAEA